MREALRPGSCVLSVVYSYPTLVERGGRLPPAHTQVELQMLSCPQLGWLFSWFFFLSFFSGTAAVWLF